jgi:cysteine desulfurase
MGLGADLAQAALRFSLGRFTTEADIDNAIEAVARTVSGLRN